MFAAGPLQAYCAPWPFTEVISSVDKAITLAQYRPVFFHVLWDVGVAFAIWSQIWNSKAHFSTYYDSLSSPQDADLEAETWKEILNVNATNKLLIAIRVMI